MTTTEQRLADALRAVLPYALNEVAAIHDCARKDGSDEAQEEGEAGDVCIEQAEQALAAYDTQASRLPTEYRVTTEWDSFEALTPREAASEVWEKIKRSEGPIFTVYGRDGSVTDVDLSEDDYHA